MSRTKTSVHTTIPRFTMHDGYKVSGMDLLDTGRLAVAGYNDTSNCSFIDLFMLKLDPDSQEKPLLLTSEPYYSDEFTEFGSKWRSVCLLDDRLFLTCCRNTIALYDSSNGDLVNQGKLKGEVWCMTTRDGLVYVVLVGSNKVIVLDARKLRKKKTITLKGLEDGDCPWDITVSNNKLFICTEYYGARVIMCNSEGEIEQEYRNTQYRRARSITVSEEKGLISILWFGGEGRQVVVYSLTGGHSSISGGHSSISGGHSSISGGHILASFKVPDYSRRIRINNNINRLFLVTETTGEVYEYHTSDIFTFDNLLMRSESLIEKDDCMKLIHYFEVPAKESNDVIKSDAPFSTLVHHLREAGKVFSDDINYLMTACSDKGQSELMTVLTVYQHAQDSKLTKKVLKDQLKALECKRQELSHKLTESKDEKQQLTGRLQTTEEERQQLKDTLKATEEERQQLKGTLKTTEEERQQLEDTLKTTEEERQQLEDTLKETKEGRQQLTGRLKTKEEERQQFKDVLKATKEERQQLTGRLQKTEEERQQYKDALKATEGERQQLTGRLKTTHEERQQFKDALKATDKDYRHTLNTAENKLKTLKDEKEELLQQQKEELEEAKSSLRATKDELVKYQLEYAKESMALQEVLKQTREALNHQQLASYAFVTAEETLLEECETSDVSQESILAADYGRLMVNVADDLTLDSTLKLATLFGLPPAETDMLRRVSLIETPGITLINFMKTRNIINMYDVTNLQKGLVYIQLNQTNENLLAPYQSKVDPFQFEDNQAPELLAWPVENVSFVPDEKSTPSQGSDEREEYHDHSKETLLERTEKEELPNQRKDSKIIEIRHHLSYIEHVIKCEGGTISIMGVHLTIPEDALSFDHVIAVKVIYDHDIHLPRSARRGRMTPLLKLEPEGLTLNKPAQLTIPHSAVIPKPDRHHVIIFTGLKDKEHSQEGEITWTEEKSIDWKLYPEKISLNIDILSYVFVNLVRQETEQKHIFRIVPFIDGILDAKDDVFITVCFCKDSDEDYKLLLEDHQSKLTLGNYTTFQVTRTLNDGRDYASYNDLMMSSPGESYHLTKEESTKLLLEDHQSKLTLGNYTTFQVTRTLNDGRDYASYIDLMMSSPGESYHLTKEESTKHVDIDHLCATSRVSHQFRLKRNNDGDNDMVDVKLKVSQHEENQTALILQSKVKDILLSPESQEILFRDLHQDLHKYEKLRGDIAKLLDKQHCIKLGGYFELTPAENETIQTAAESGKMLMKILDERELIMPDRMIGMYEGLKAIDFDKVARLVLEYIGTLQEKNGKENEGEKDDMKMVNIAEKQKVISKSEPKLSVCFKILIEEGYKRLDVQRALKLSHGKLDLGRRILLLAKEEHDILPSNLLQMELWVNKDGGLLELPDTGVSLEIPPGALEKDQLIQMRIIPYNFRNDSDLSFTSNSSVVVELLPSNLKLLKLAKLTLPHCLVLKKGCEWKAKIYSSHHEEGTQPLWRPQPDTPYVLTERNCVIKLRHFSWKKFEIGNEIVEGKRIMLYAAKDLSSSQSITLIHVGYYFKLPGNEKVVDINKVSVLVKKLAVFFKDGRLPLKCQFDRTDPQDWIYCSEEENPKELSFECVATSEGGFCTFALHIKEGTQERRNCACYFKAGQGSKLAELLFILKEGEKGSDKLVVTGLSQSQKKTCDENLAAKQLPENIDLPVREGILRNLSEKIPQNWKDVGRYLGLEDSELSTLKDDNPKLKETVYQMLLTWKARKGSGATYRELGEALDRAGRRDLQEWLYNQATIQDDNL